MRAPPLDAPPGPAGRVLVVDDTPETALILSEQVRAAGYQVEAVHGGQAALERFPGGGFDVVLLDLMMPDLDGVETCRRLRALPGGEAVPVVLLTARRDAGAQRAALDSGADDFLHKPVSQAELVLRVRSLVRVSGLNRRLAEERDALRREREERRRLMAMVVHDLKNPLTAVSVYGHLLEEEPSLSRDNRQLAAGVAEAARRMSSLVHNLLDLARSEEGRLVVRSTPLDLASYLERWRQDVRLGHPAGAALELELGEPLPLVLVDPALLRRVLDNLLDNAAKYAPRGGRVRLGAGLAGGEVVVRVSDEGAGVPTAQRDRIFEPFVRMEVDGDRHAPASQGLGLAFCRQAVEAMRGRIWVEDGVPRGASFCVALPAHRPGA